MTEFNCKRCGQEYKADLKWVFNNGRYCKECNAIINELSKRKMYGTYHMNFNRARDNKI